MQSLRDQGCDASSPACQLVENWLAEQTRPELRAAWKQYVAELCPLLDDQAKSKLRDDVLGRARAVAEAAGGILGLGNKISDAEQSTLDDLAASFG